VPSNCLVGVVQQTMIDLYESSFGCSLELFTDVDLDANPMVCPFEPSSHVLQIHQGSVQEEPTGCNGSLTARCLKTLLNLIRQPRGPAAQSTSDAMLS
jgi:hypothetical protein